MKQNKSENRNLWLFFLITFVWSWTFWLPEILWNVRLFLGPFGPFIAAFLLIGLNEGKGGVIKLLKRGIDFRFGKIWFIPIFLLFPVITGAALFLSTFTGEFIPELPLLHNPLLIIYWFGYMLFLGGPFQEEFGWRGYALDRLQARYNALKSSIILGIIWALWHSPLFFITEATIQYQIQNFFSSIILFIFMTILFTWIYNNTGGSILAALLFHAMLNLSTYKLFPVLESQISGLFYYILIVITAIVVLKIWGPKRMVRERHFKTTSPNSG